MDDQDFTKESSKFTARTDTTDVSRCTCETDTEGDGSNPNCEIHGRNPDHRLGKNSRKSMGKGKKLSHPQQNRPRPESTGYQSPDQDTEASAEDIGAETIGALKEYHGHNRYDINNHVEKDDDSGVEDEMMRTALNGVLHMGSTDPEQVRRMKELADEIPDSPPQMRQSPTRSPQARESPTRQPPSRQSQPREHQPRESPVREPPTRQPPTRAPPPAAEKITHPKVERRQAPPPTPPPVIKHVKQPPAERPPAERPPAVPKPQRSAHFKAPPQPKVDIYDDIKPRKVKRSKVPSHKIRARSLKPPPDKVAMPLQPPPLGYRWSYRRFSANNERQKILDHRHYITPPFRWVLVPTDLSLKKPKSYDYLRDAKYGYRNQMDADDFSVTNFYNFPPYCYPVTEPLRFPYHNFNAPPFQQRAPLYFIHSGGFDDKTNEDSISAIQICKDGDVKLSRSVVRHMVMQQSEKGKRKTQADTTRDAWAGYKPKFVKSPVQRIWRYNWHKSPPKSTLPKPEIKTKKPTKPGEEYNEVTSRVITRPELITGKSYW